MLRIGHRSYELVRGTSQFHVTIGGRKRGETEQQWMFDAHYVPSAEDFGREDGEPEYLQLTIHPFRLALGDWRELTKFAEPFEIEGGTDPLLFRTKVRRAKLNSPSGIVRGTAARWVKFSTKS